MVRVSEMQRVASNQRLDCPASHGIIIQEAYSVLGIVLFFAVYQEGVRNDDR